MAELSLIAIDLMGSVFVNNRMDCSVPAWIECNRSSPSSNLNSKTRQNEYEIAMDCYLRDVPDVLFAKQNR